MRQKSNGSGPLMRIVQVSSMGLGCSLGLGLLAWVVLGLGIWSMPGVHMAGRPLPARRALLPALRENARIWEEHSLTIDVGHHVFQPQRAVLGFGLSTADAERELRALGRSPNPLVALHELGIGLFGRGHALQWRPRIVDASALDRFLERVRDQVERLPIPGSYAPDGTPIEGLPGEAFDVAVAHRAIERALVRGDSVLTLATVVTPPPAGYLRFDRPLAQKQTNVLMKAQETAYRPGTGRATNIELAAHKLDGTLLLPGATFSFNAVVGKRERARGFAPALELLGGELVEGVGGGVCQVAGTLHAAAFFAGLKVDEYHAHSRLNRLAYLPPGLDAMVAWPQDARELRDTKDMRLRNPYPFPVRIAVKLVRAASQNLLQIELYGAAPPFRVEYRFEELERVAAAEIRRADPTLPPGETRVQQTALDGLLIARRRTIYTPLGRIEEQTRVAYPPTARIVRVGP